MTTARNADTTRRYGNWAMPALLAGVVAGFVLGRQGLLPIPEVRWCLPARTADEYAPAHSLSAGPEVAFVFVGSSTCGWSNVPELPDLVKELKRELSQRAANLGMSFAAVGVARDLVAADGIRHLDKFGDFDEVMSGRGWTNTGVLKYVYGDDSASPGVTPQVLVVERSLDDKGGHMSPGADRVVVRREGLDQIKQWVRAGAPTPLLGDGPGVADPK